MSLKIEDGYEKTRIYRDGRSYFYIWALCLSSFIILDHFYGVGEANGERSFIAWLVLMPFGWLFVRWGVHGSITLDGTRRVLEFSKRWNLNTPSLTVASENIDKIKMYTRTISPAPVGAPSYGLILCVKEKGKYKQKKLELLFFDYDDWNRAAHLIGKFANKPAFDDKGTQIFTPKK